MKCVREQVVDLLIEVEQNQSYAQLSLKNALKTLERRDRALATELFYGTLKYQIQLDYWLNRYSKHPVQKMKPLIRNILRMSLYQMLYLDKIPTSATINEAVKIVKKRNFKGLAGFVNGLLRTLDKENLDITAITETSLSQKLSIQYALPEWVIKMWLEAYDSQQVEEICQALNERPEVCGRWNTLKGTKETILNELRSEGIEVKEGYLLKEAFYLKKADHLQELPSFQNGLWTVQDESAMLVAPIVGPKEGDSILDMCSAPGGKSMHMAALMHNKGCIIACDKYPHKLELIEKNAERLGITIIKPTLQDATCFNCQFVEKFDKILLDVPCSGLGIMKRKPDIRLYKTEEDLEEITKIQKAIIQNAICYLKPNGRLVYSTCTISKKENEQIVDFIIQSSKFVLESIIEKVPDCLRKYVVNKGMIQILPQMAHTDGFFIACFRKGNKNE